MPDFGYAIWILILPVAAFLFAGLLGNKMKPAVAGIVATVSLGISCVLSWLLGIQYFSPSAESSGIFEPVISHTTRWLTFNSSLYIDMGILLDPISVMMLIVITTISFLVHVYSLGYMKGEKGFARYFSFLSLFSFSMLGLVVATNIFQMYIFWELVGVSSYLLIGFYYDKPSAVAAAKKAFIVTRFADLGFLVGILVLSFFTGTFDFQQLVDPSGPAIAHGGTVAFLGLSVTTWAVLLIFMGGAGKSAMFPLHIWLPDAMEGPTPVSALIHAATMVVAGVYLVARLFPVFALGSPAALDVVAFVGAFTSLFAAVIACTQHDIKRVLAYSTMSQIGYMMLALGVSGYGGISGSGYSASMFHLFTHAFFKALLFLGAGVIIHSVHSNSMKDMGGLRKHLPITSVTFFIACLAIAGIPPFAGFFSKDEILSAAYASNKFYFAIEYLVAGLTAFYMFRLYYRVFWGRASRLETVKKPSVTMRMPLVILALGSAVAGFVPFNKLVTSDRMVFDLHFHWGIAIPSVLIALAGIIAARILYKNESVLPARITKSLGGFYTAAKARFYVDELYVFITKKIIFNLIARPIAWFDRHIVDGFMNQIAGTIGLVSKKIKILQSGQLQQYAFIFVSGVLLLTLFLVYWLKN